MHTLALSKKVLTVVGWYGAIAAVYQIKMVVLRDNHKAESLLRPLTASECRVGLDVMCPVEEGFNMHHCVLMQNIFLGAFLYRESICMS